MREMHSIRESERDPVQDSFEEGMLGDDYELVGFYRDGSDPSSDDSSDFDFEIFIVSAVTEV